LNAEYVWRSGAEVLLRIEDHDRERCRPEFEAGILEDLDWLRYRADFPLVRQSERDDIYSAAIEDLARQRLVYACDCTRAHIEARTSRTPQPSSELVYDGFCRDRGLALAGGVGWRVRMDAGVESFVDERLGPQQQDPSVTGDVLVRDRLGNWTYQWCVSVDDYRQGIDLIIRGEDLLPSTGRQLRIARLLGRARQATFFHHPLLMKSPTQKLSKSDGDTGIRELRARGWTPEQVKHAARSTVL
jgi:glutamyl/glutaminyl-tRNA synthetase